MTPQRAVVPQADPVPPLGPVLVSGTAQEPAALSATVLTFPAPAPPAVAPADAVSAAAANIRAARLAEYLVLFGAIPLILSLPIADALPRLAMLWIAAASALFFLGRDPTFHRRELWNARPLARHLPQLLALFAAGAVVVSALVRVYLPRLFLTLPRLHPGFWAFVMVSYPVLSVYPQGLVYRTWILHRYRPVFQPAGAPPALLLSASAIAFAAMHLIFHNWIAVAATFPGGILFARRHLDSRSLLVSSLEHALYGCFLFTIGLGQFFGLQAPLH
jgi:uncharacterized protein